MKKFMRIALVFALAGAALVGCTKDYSGDISDLNKEVSAIQSTLTSLQTSIQGAQSAADAAAATANTALSAAKAAATADDLKAVQTALAAAATSAELTAVDAKYAAYIPAIKAAATADDLKALETAITAAIAATDVKVADLEKALEAYAKKADLDEAVTKLGELETNYIALEARVAKLEAAEEDIQKLIDANAKGIETNAKAIEDLQKKVEELLAQNGDAFSVEAITGTAKYASAKWNPGNKAGEKKLLAKLTEVFPELADLKKGDKVETFGHIDFIVNPSSVVLDDTYKFALIGKNGKDSKVVLGNPTKGSATKAGLNVWNVEVQSPAYNDWGQPITEEVEGLALVVENAAGVYAQTNFNYAVENSSNGGEIAIYHQKDTLKFDDTKAANTVNAFNKLFKVTGGALYDNYFIIEADAADVEEFGIEFDGKKIALTETPTEALSKIKFTITAVGVDGSVDSASDTLVVTYKKSIAPNAELAAQDVTLGYDATKPAADQYKVPVKYSVESFGFSALEWKTVYTDLKKNATITVKDSKNAEHNTYVGTPLNFYKANGLPASGYSDAVAFGFDVKSDVAVPGTYTVAITSDEGIFAGKGELTIANPETCPVKLIEALCKDGVLQIVGTVSEDGETISYALEDALVYNTKEASIVAESFVDLDQTSSDEDNWVKDSVNFSIPTAKPGANLLYTPRNFSVKFNWFANTTADANVGTFEFQAQAVSPIYAEGGKGAVEVNNQTIYLGGDDETEFTSFEVNKIVKSAKYVAGDDVDKEYNVFQVWKTVAEVPARYKHTFVADPLKNYSSTDASTQPQSGWGDNTNPDCTIYQGALVLDNNGDFITVDTGDANILRGFGLNDKEILNVRNQKTPLYLTQPMLDTAFGVWTKYYDDFGDARIAKPENKKSIYPAAWNKYVNNATESDDLATITNMITAINAFTTDENAKTIAWNSYSVHHTGNLTIDQLWAKLTTQYIFDGDKNAIKAYNYIKSHFDTETTEKYNEKEDATYAKDTEKKRSAAIKSVKVAFDNPDYADEFIANVGEITNPYEGAHSETISVDPLAKFKAGLTSVTLPAYIEIADNWGMTMKIPFTVTVKVASK